MARKNILGLDSIASTDVVAADLLPVWDTSAGFTKKLTASTILDALLRVSADGLATAWITPATITGATNNYSPGVGVFQRWSSSTEGLPVTGMVAGVDGETRFVRNVGTKYIELQIFSTSSVAANRLTSADTGVTGLAGRNIILGAGELVLFQYSTTTSRWLVTKLRGDSAWGTLVVRALNGTADTEIHISHEGTGNPGSITCVTGDLRLRAPNGGIVVETTVTATESMYVASGTFGTIELTNVADGVVRLSLSAGAVGATISSPALDVIITGDVDNFAPGVARRYRLTPDAAWNLTGFAAGIDGQECWFLNVGAFNVTLTHQDGASAVGNQFYNETGADIVLAPDQTVSLWYDVFNSSWRVKE